MRGDGLKPLVRAGGGGEKDGCKSYALHLGQIFSRLFDNQVSHQHPVDASGCGIIRKTGQAVAQDGIEVTENHEARAGTCRTKLGGQRQHIL